MISKSSTWITELNGDMLKISINDRKQKVLVPALQWYKIYSVNESTFTMIRLGGDRSHEKNFSSGCEHKKGDKLRFCPDIFSSALCASGKLTMHK